MKFPGVAYLRISTKKQYTEGDSPEEQLESIMPLVELKNAELLQTFIFPESGGNPKKHPLESIYKFCVDNKIVFVFLKNIDRLTRTGGRGYYYLLDKFKAAGIEIVDSEGVISYENKNTLENHKVKYEWSTYRPTEPEELRRAQEAEAERRRILTRVIGAEIRFSRLGYWIGGINYGYISKKEQTPHGRRSILYPEPTEAKFIKMMFELRAKGHTLEKITQTVNDAGYKSRIMRRRSAEHLYTGEKPLTLKQLQKYLENPVYCLVRAMRRQVGIDERGRKRYRKDEPVRVHGEQIISDELFNKANNGKIAVYERDNGKIEIVKGGVPEWRLFKNVKSEDYPFKQYVLCPECKKPFMGSASRGKSGKLYPAYHCNRSHKLYRVPVKNFNDAIANFVKKIELDDTTILRLKEAYARQFEERRKHTRNFAEVIQMQIKDKLDQQDEMIRRVENYTSPILIRRVEENIEKLDLEIKRLQNARNNQEDKKMLAQKEIMKFWYFLEHLEELVINPDKSIQSAMLFSLIFDEIPTFEDILNPTAQTLNLAWCFKLKRNEDLAVIRQGLEP